MKTPKITLTEEEAVVLAGLLERITRANNRLAHQADLEAFLREKSYMIPHFEDLAVLAKSRGLYSMKTGTSDSASSLRKLSISLGLHTDH